MLRDALSISVARRTTHFRDQMLKRHIEMNDVMHVVRTGAIRRAPEYHIKLGTWEYRAEGADVDGEPLEIVFAIDPDKGVTLITGIRP